MHPEIYTLLTGLAGGFMGFVYVPAMLLGIGAWGIWAGVIVTEAIERNFRA